MTFSPTLLVVPPAGSAMASGRGATGSEAALTLWLSIFLAILTVFVALSAQIIVDRPVAPAAAAPAAATTADASSSEAPAPPSAGGDEASKAATTAIAELAKAMVALSPPSPPPPPLAAPLVAQIAVPLTALYDPGIRRLVPANTPIIDRIIATQASLPVELRLDIALPRALSVPGHTGEATGTAVIVDLARLLIARGVSDRSLTTTVRDSQGLGLDTALIITFYARGRPPPATVARSGLGTGSQP